MNQMNKITIYNCNCVYRNWCDWDSDGYTEAGFDAEMYERYSLKCIAGYQYEITDESGFALFMLIHSDAIQTISYE